MATTPFSVCKEFCAGDGGASNAKDVKYDNKTSGLKADNVGGAIDEICTKMNDIDTTKNWNQNDPKKADYIENRPFYEDGTKVKQLEEKFIPDTIARTEDVDKKMEDAEANVADKIAESLVPFEVLKIKPTASGEIISLTDSTEAPLQSMKIFGKTEQFTTTGKNKLPYPYFFTTRTQNGITFTDNGDGSITVNGTATADTYFYLADHNTITPFEVGKTYCINTRMSNVQVILVYKDGNGGEHYIGSNMITSFAWAEGYKLVNIYLLVKNGVTLTETVYPIIVEGDSYDGIWEPYTGGIPSPNPSYPQALESVGDDGSVEQVVCGKNLFDNDTSLLKEVTYTNSQGGQNTRIGYEPIVLPAGTYTFTLTDLDTSLTKYVYGVINDKDGKIVRACNLLQGTNNYTPLTITVNEGDKIYIYDGQTYLNITERSKTFKAVQIHLNAGSVAKPYEPYKSQSLTIPTPNGLPGTPVSSGGNYTDSNGQQYVCDEVDFERGVYVQHIGEYRNTGEPMSMYSAKAGGNGITYWNQYIGVTNLAPGNYRILSNAFRDSLIFGDYRNVPYTCIFNVSEVNEVRRAYLYFSILTSDTEYGTTYTKEREAISAWLAKTFSEDNPLIVRYQLAEPIETPLTEEEIQAYKALHTNYPNTTIYNSDGAGAEVEYLADTKNYIDNKIADEVAKLTAAIITE